MGWVLQMAYQFNICLRLCPSQRGTYFLTVFSSMQEYCSFIYLLDK